MNRVLAGSILWLSRIANAAAQELIYSLTVIEEEETPLADGSLFDKSRFFPVTMAVMAVLFVGMLISLYYFRCLKYRKRIRELGGERVPHSGWNLKRLKETVTEIEWELVGEEN